MKDLVFFTMNDFQREGGGTIRMLGIINELANVRPNIILVSNILDKTKVNAAVKHIPIDHVPSKSEKRKIQFYLGLLNYKMLNLKERILLKKLEGIFAMLNSNSKFIFFEYLDNSIGYWLKMNKLINGYTNDIHGIASNEFDFQAKRATALNSNLLFHLKKLISERLDAKVFNHADGIFYASNAMYEYYLQLYPSLKYKKNYFLPYVLNQHNVLPSNPVLINKIKESLHIKETDFVFLFAGAYKETGGIQDLIVAFDLVSKKFGEAKLLLVGDGPTFQDCKNIAQTLEHRDRVFFLGRQPYNDLASFQEIAKVIVCPDRQNLFSDLIVHVKYLDALISGKIVINGKFRSVMEINTDHQLSLLFKPSDINDLAEQMLLSIINYSKLTELFRMSKDYTLQNLTYSRFIKNLTD